MWLRHWGLARDPFAELGSPYVSLPSHDEAVARLVYAVESGLSHVVVRAAGGLGKTTVLRRAIGQIRGPRRRIVVAGGPFEEAIVLGRFAEGLGAKVGQHPSLGQAWRSLEYAVRVLCIEGFQVVLAIDGCSGSPGDLSSAIVRLWRAGLSDRRGVTVVAIRGDNPDGSALDDDRWALEARLKPLTRTETDDYLNEKLAAADCRTAIFTSRAITRLQALCAGIPRGVERLATLSLMAGATRGIDLISPELVDEVATD
jgi:hypothetical protein